jgi:hypothetical protein
MIQGLYFQGSMEFLGDDVLMVAKQPSVRSDPNDKDYQVVDISNPLHPNPVTEKQVLEKITNDETGTTFLLTAEGLYLVRQPDVEEEFKTRREQQFRHTP